MNKGPAVRLQPASTGPGGRPVIFWEQQAIEAKNNKAKKQRFGYKDRNVKRPLRDKVPEPEPKIQNNRKAVNAKENGKTAVNKTGAQNARNPAKPKPDPNAVTLTQKQLDSILDTIGHLTLENEELQIKNTSGEINRGTINHEEATPDNNQVTSQNGGSGDHNTVVVSRSAIPGLENHVAPGDVGANAHDATSATPNRETVRSSEQNANKPVAFMSKAELKRKQWEMERAEQEKLEAQTAAAAVAASVTSHQQNAVTGHQQNTVTGHHTGSSPGLTKLQQKRLQWEKEKAEIPKEFDPWGRPGAGAPSQKDAGSTVLADYSNRMSQDFQDSGSSKQAWAETTPNVIQKLAPGYTSPRHQPSPSWAKDQHAAIRSNFTVGNNAPDENHFMSAKEAQKKQWLADLEKQKEEKRLQKLMEKQQRQDGEDRWADRFSNYQPAGMPQQTTKPIETERISSAPTAPPVTQTQEIPQELALESSQNNSFLRGQNAPLDPVTKKELSDKRRKYQELQDALKAQMEERDRLKREAREMRYQEERAEEEKLAKEREALQTQFDNEKQKQRDKEEAQKRRVDVLKEAMEKAQQDAEREKHKRRLERLQQGGHDTSHLQANFEAPTAFTPDAAVFSNTPELVRYHTSEGFTARMTPRMVGGVILPTPPTVGGAANPNNVTVVAPTYIPGLHPTPRGADPPTVLDRDEPYTENRVLTPTLYRGHSMPKKEFGVQTDPSLLQKFQQDFDDRDQRYFGEKSNRKVRLKSPPEEREKRDTKKGPVKINERPRWGATKQTKKSVKQSERDLKMQQKKEEAAAKRQARQQQMLEMAERNAPRASQRATNASRARSRSRNREDDSPVVHAVHSNERPDSDNAHFRQHQSPYASPSKVRNMPQPNNSHSRMADNHNSENLSHNNHHARTTNRSSPPIPAISHRLTKDSDTDSYNYNNHGNYDRIAFSSRTQYQDSDLTGRTSDNSFVPFVRTQEILDPAHADDPVPLSREATAVQRARQAYNESREPANFGTQLANIQDRPVQETMPSNWLKDPIMNPTVVKGHPTPRQDRILQQLSDLRKGLRQKQRELEVGMSTMSLAVEDQ